MNFDKGVPFDPGYSQYTFRASDNLDQFDAVMAGIKAPHQKKFQYKMVSSKILMLLQNSVAFYLGCLFWASYINQNFKDSPKDILDNNFYGKEVNEEAIFFEINYITDYFSKYEKDCKYYLGKCDGIPENWKKIMDTYREFLTLNNNFTNAKTTADLKLPPAIKFLSQESLDKIYEKIVDVVKTGKIEELFEIESVLI